MKTGTENKRKVMVMVVLMAIAISAGLYNFKDMLSSPGAAMTSTKPRATEFRETAAISIDADSRLNLDDLERSRAIRYQLGRNIFEMQQPPLEKFMTDVRKPEISIAHTPAPQAAPSIPLTFYGFTNRSGDRKKIFLQQHNGGRVFVANQGDVIDRRYRVVQIQANSVLMEDMLTNNRQPIPLTPR